MADLGIVVPYVHKYNNNRRYIMSLKRDLENKIIAGVCAGIANEVKVDPVIVRLAFILAAFFTVGLPVIVYVLMWLLMPTE